MTETDILINDMRGKAWIWIGQMRLIRMAH